MIRKLEVVGQNDDAIFVYMFLGTPTYSKRDTSGGP